MRYSQLAPRCGWFVLLLILALPLSLLAGITIGPESKVPSDPRQTHARWVRFRPADGQVVTLNPPRFSWPISPDTVVEGRIPASQRFTLQIAKDKEFKRPEVEIRDTPYNFYNFLPELKGARTWYWRAGYHIEGQPVRWSATRSFQLADDAVVWDRSDFPKILDGIRGHPRILFNAANRKEIFQLDNRDQFSRELASYIIRNADRMLQQKWYQNFPKDDKAVMSYMDMGRSLVTVSFAWLLTGDEKYLGFKPRFLTMAAYPPGGGSSPEGMAKNDKWNTHLAEYFGLFYDWFYYDLTPAERATVRHTLEWRIQHTIHNFAWRSSEGKTYKPGSIAVQCTSHPFENTMVTLSGALAICDESPVAREAFEMGVHYLAGITVGMGEDEGWNEGPGYGNGKMKWLMDLTGYLQTAAPALHLERNEVYGSVCDFFARLTPVGAKHSSFGNRGYSESDWCSSRVNNFRRVAMFGQNAQAMQNWIATRQRMREVRESDPMPASPWIDFVLSHYAQEPTPKTETVFNKAFPLEGWVMVNSAAPSDYAAQKNAVSMTFTCRPRGGYSHAFRCENAFDIHAYGETVAVGGDTTSNQSFFSNHTMSHNTVLVNGHEQQAAKDNATPMCGRVIAFKEGRDFVYWAGDATPAYGKETGLGRFVRHVVFADQAYFVIFDELEMANEVGPGRFQWLYHITPTVPLDFNSQDFTLRYSIGNVRVLLQHLAHQEDLTFQDYPKEGGMKNPVTGEDVSRNDKWLNADKSKSREKKAAQPLDAHHLWISHKTPQRQMQFLAVIVPLRPGDAEPVITRLSDCAVRVNFRGSQKVISFQKDPAADLAIDVAALR